MVEETTDDMGVGILLYMIYAYSAFVLLTLVQNLDGFRDIGLGRLFLQMAAIFCSAFMVVYSLLIPYLLSLLDN